MSASLKRPPQPPLRSLLYVPGNKLEWMRKAPKYGADALIFDLEDSVPPEQKSDSRSLVRQAIDELGPAGRPRLVVRINDVRSGRAEADLEAIVAAGLFGIWLSATGKSALSMLPTSRLRPLPRFSRSSFPQRPD